MNKDFLDTIYLFSCASYGVKPEEKREYNFKEIYNISKSQGVWETVFLAISDIYKENPQIIPKETFEKMSVQSVMSAGIQYKRLSFIHSLIKKLEENGIECSILKGESISRLYHTPIARVSSDADILIKPEKADECLRIMEDMGFTIGEKVYESHQIECTHPIAGLVEIHTMMYGKRTEDVSFRNEVKYDEKRITLKAEDGTEYKTLGITDNFLFLFLHFTKHFLFQGAGIRQLGDLLIYTKNCFREIDWERANRSIKNLGFEKFFKYIIRIGEIYFMFPENLIKTDELDEDIVERVFEDMFSGGLFGHEDGARHGFYNLYLSERSKSGKSSYEAYKNKRKLSRLFPNIDFMSVNYPYVKKAKILLPIAWMHRILKGLIPLKRKKETISNEHKERLDLLRKLEMV